MGMFDKLLKLNFRNEYFLLSSNVPFDAYFQRELLTVVKPCVRLFSSEKRERRWSWINAQRCVATYSRERKITHRCFVVVALLVRDTNISHGIYNYVVSNVIRKHVETKKRKREINIASEDTRFHFVQMKL